MKDKEIIMTRITISLPQNIHHHLSALAAQSDESMSSIINKFLNIGLQQAPLEQKTIPTAIEEHCYKLIMQMSVLIKHLSAELLKLNQDEFGELRALVIERYQEILDKM